MNQKARTLAYLVGSVIVVVIAGVLVGIVTLRSVGAEGGDPIVRVLLPSLLWVGVLMMIRGFWKGYVKLKSSSLVE